MRLRPAGDGSHAPKPVDPGGVWMPNPFGFAMVPLASVPMNMPLRPTPIVPSPTDMRMPLPAVNPLIAMPLRPWLSLAISNPLPEPADEPLISIRTTALLPYASALGLEPGCEKPSMAMRLQASCGNGDVGWMVWTPAPGVLNVI